MKPFTRRDFLKAAGGTAAGYTVRVPVAARVPRLFARAVNQDGDLNSETNSSSRGSLVTVYVTGQGRAPVAHLVIPKIALDDIVLEGVTAGSPWSALSSMIIFSRSPSFSSRVSTSGSLRS